jgi:hypothetical protein
VDVVVAEGDWHGGEEGKEGKVGMWVDERRGKTVDF